MEDRLKYNVVNATRWSSITEILAKVVVPISNMVLARVLTPEAFGVIATVTMIISFADMFTDSGFQKYLIQRRFQSEEELETCKNVAFSANLCISLILWGVIIILAEQMAIVVGNKGLGNVIIIASFSLPITSFSSIQMALYKKDLNYKTLFKVRMIEVLIPFIVTIPLAIIGFGYWALIIGILISNLTKAVILTVSSKYKYKINLDIKILKKMLSFSIWSLAETIGSWLTSYIGTFIIGSILTDYYVGLYKTTITTIDGIMAIITGATTSILFSYLSKIQDNDKDFKKVFLNFIQNVSMILIPMGVGIYIYKDFIIDILLGKQWSEAYAFAGIWGLMSSITLVCAQYSYEVYRAKGKPKISVLVQILNLIVVIPVLLIGAKKGFNTLIYYASLVKIWQIIVNLIIMNKIFNIHPIEILGKILPFLANSWIMGLIGIGLRSISKSYIWCLISIIICVMIYIATFYMIPKNRKYILSLIQFIGISNTNNIEEEDVYETS